MLPFSMLERFKPMFISSMIEEEDLDCKATNGMEMIIMQEAKEQNKKINGLETAEFQAGLFDSIPYEKQAQSLMNYIDSAEDYKNIIIKTIPGTGELVYLKDVARVELGKFTFSSNSFVDGHRASGGPPLVDGHLAHAGPGGDGLWTGRHIRGRSHHGAGQLLCRRSEATVVWSSGN